MWQEIVSVIISNGIFAILFVFLFCYQLKDSKQARANYQKTIEDLTAHIGVINEIKADVAYLKEAVSSKRRRKNEDKKLDPLL